MKILLNRLGAGMTYYMLLVIALGMTMLALIAAQPAAAFPRHHDHLLPATPRSPIETPRRR